MPEHLFKDILAGVEQVAAENVRQRKFAASEKSAADVRKARAQSAFIEDRLKNKNLDPGIRKMLLQEQVKSFAGDEPSGVFGDILGGRQVLQAPRRLALTPEQKAFFPAHEQRPPSLDELQDFASLRSTQALRGARGSLEDVREETLQTQIAKTKEAQTGDIAKDIVRLKNKLTNSTKATESGAKLIAKRTVAAGQLITSLQKETTLALQELGLFSLPDDKGKRFPIKNMTDFRTKLSLAEQERIREDPDFSTFVAKIRKVTAARKFRQRLLDRKAPTRAEIVEWKGFDFIDKADIKALAEAYPSLRSALIQGG